MTLEERQKAFMDELNALGQKYGIQVGAQVQARQLGPVVQCEPVVVLQPIDDWREDDGHSNGKLTPGDLMEIAQRS